MIPADTFAFGVATVLAMVGPIGMALRSWRELAVLDHESRAVTLREDLLGAIADGRVPPDGAAEQVLGRLFQLSGPREDDDAFTSAMIDVVAADSHAALARYERTLEFAGMRLLRQEDAAVGRSEADTPAVEQGGCESVGIGALIGPSGRRALTAAVARSPGRHVAVRARALIDH